MSSSDDEVPLAARMAVGAAGAKRAATAAALDDSSDDDDVPLAARVGMAPTQLLQIDDQTYIHMCIYT